MVSNYIRNENIYGRNRYVFMGNHKKTHKNIMNAGKQYYGSFEGISFQTKI